MKLVVADFNNDGFVDVIATDAEHFYQRFGGGTGNFTGTNAITVPSMVTSIAASDINADGSLDSTLLFYSGLFPNRRQVYLDSSIAGIFIAGPSANISSEGLWGNLANLTGDGVLDLVVGANASSGLDDTAVHTGDSGRNLRSLVAHARAAINSTLGYVTRTKTAT